MKPSENLPPQAKQRVLVVDDHPVFRFGLTKIIDAEPDLVVCGEAGSAPQALEAVRQLSPDLALVDVSLNGANGIELIKQIRAENNDTLILIVSMHDESLYAMRALRAGARGYVMKREALHHVINAIHTVLSGKIHVSPALNEQLIFQLVQGADSTAGSPLDRLTDREMEILHLIGFGHSTRQIADELHLSGKTVETHRLHMREKLGFKASQELTRFAMEWAAQQANA